MSLFKKLSGSKDDNLDNNDASDSQTEFSEGDIFYTYFDNHFHINKLLKFEREFNTYHILSYQPVEQLPEIREIENLGIFIHHAPIDKNGFENPKLLTKSKVSANDLRGYHEYLRQTHGTEDLIATAGDYYSKGNLLAEEKRFEESIDEYSKAIDLIPVFYEAIDNRAFSKMDLARWAEAIEDFELSLQVNPESVIAEFSIGECYLKSGDYIQAKEHFEKALIIDPTDQLSKDFLNKVIELRKFDNQKKLQKSLLKIFPLLPYYLFSLFVLSFFVPFACLAGKKF
ncbi:MAG: tetratricopeptide repeat protein [Acidobacteria bacterium]|jgi:tetratricopeptide (TPR) repeat protein|nr:tetratricopeptide repeat protein [Acidobacteriota bacterium]MBA3784671.1 tetratricopeptide repeat protein [Acidobacteriota bacterium]MBA4184696.1 tetratricopeptide repeat protein [Acidobacteriota bacterium]